ncbi:hypothetical protein V2J09_015404 [Rumex salicifolius]
MGRLRSLQLILGFVILYCFLLLSSHLFIFLRSFSTETQNPNLLPDSLFDPPFETPKRILSNLVFTESKTDNSSLHKSAMEAWSLGSKILTQLVRRPKPTRNQLSDRSHNKTTPCPRAISVSGGEFAARNGAVTLPCGLSLGSHVTVVGKPLTAHVELFPAISGGRMSDVMVSQFMLELRKVNGVVAAGEEPARILHFNPRIKGDWSGGPVIEMNACYRSQWGTAIRCEGWPAMPSEETVDGNPICDEWQRDDDHLLDNSKAGWWVKHLLKQEPQNAVKWPYPFVEDKYFVLTVSTGLEGYHINVDGRHIASFFYRTGYDLEDATGIHIHGDVEVHSVHAASLPTLHPSIARHRYLDMSPHFKAPVFHGGPTELFVGIISAGDHFAERMAIRKSWMRHYLIKSSKVVARFFIALHEREAVNVELMKEAEFFGDIVLLPYLDNYDLVVLKTVAICEHGVNTFAANYIMKCDDDTFVSLDSVFMIAEKFGADGSIYIGKMNYYHKPLREGKWSVTFEEWAEEYYPTYADGAAYAMSLDIARFIVSEFQKNKLRLFKMEDVSMGMWVEQFNSSKTVEYLHSSRFVQSGCVDGYFTVHYQSPKQMLCLWKKLQNEGKPICCNWFPACPYLDQSIESYKERELCKEAIFKIKVEEEENMLLEFALSSAYFDMHEGNCIDNQNILQFQINKLGTFNPSTHERKLIK